jgi:hypothetical protein
MTLASKIKCAMFGHKWHTKLISFRYYKICERCDKVSIDLGPLMSDTELEIEKAKGFGIHKQTTGLSDYEELIPDDHGEIGVYNWRTRKMYLKNPDGSLRDQ